MATQHEYNWPINPVTVNSGPVEYDLNGVPTIVNIDTGTPTNSTPLPVKLYGTNGLPADYSTAANQTTQIANQVTAQASLSAIAASDASIDGKTPTVGQKAMAGSSPIAIASDQSAIPVTVASLPLPAGAATSANQATEITSLASIVTNTTGVSTAANQATEITSLGHIDTATASLNTKLPAQGQALMAASLPVVIASNQSAIPASQSGTWNITNVSGTVSLPTGAATSALQTTGNTSLGTLVTSNASMNSATGATTDTAATTDTGSFSIISFIKRGMQNWTSLLAKIPALGQAVMASSMPVTIASNQSALAVTQSTNVAGATVSQALTTTATTVTKPSSVVGFVVQNDAASLDFIRVAIGVTATASVGIVLQPGQDTGFIPAALNLSIIANSGTPVANVMWV